MVFISSTHRTNNMQLCTVSATRDVKIKGILISHLGHFNFCTLHISVIYVIVWMLGSCMINTVNPTDKYSGNQGISSFFSIKGQSTSHTYMPDFTYWNECLRCLKILAIAYSKISPFHCFVSRCTSVVSFLRHFNQSDLNILI